MLKILTIALVFAVLLVAEMKLQPQANRAVACSYSCLVSLQLASLNQGN
jgi:hypothetical protein